MALFNQLPTLLRLNDPTLWANVYANMLWAIIGASLFGVGGALLRWYEESRGRLYGEWTGFVFNDDGSVRMRDRYLVKQRKDRVFVRGFRIFPAYQEGWSWTLNGIDRENSLAGYFASTDPRKHSFGVIYLRANRDSTKMTGYYMGHRVEITGTVQASDIVPVRLEWVRGKHEHPPEHVLQSAAA